MLKPTIIIVDYASLLAIYKLLFCKCIYFSYNVVDYGRQSLGYDGSGEH